jgi:alcohol dehydrogenase (NADP+)
MQIQRRAVGANDVLLDVMYCGVCHSDIHQARNGWPVSQPTQYPCVTGHEIIGRVVAIGNAVTKFRVGDIGGVGAMVDSCGVCETCLAGRGKRPLSAAAAANRPALSTVLQWILLAADMSYLRG